jgi:hypothetical protein
MEPESIKIDATPRVLIVLFVELKNIAPPPVSNFETVDCNAQVRERTTERSCGSRFGKTSVPLDPQFGGLREA